MKQLRAKIVFLTSGRPLRPRGTTEKELPQCQNEECFAANALRPPTINYSNSYNSECSKAA
jgi:hypothetical protein